MSRAIAVSFCVMLARSSLVHTERSPPSTARAFSSGGARSCCPERSVTTVQGPSQSISPAVGRSRDGKRAVDGGDRSVWTNDDQASITQNETAIALDMCHHPHPELTLWAGSSRRKPAQHRRRRRHPLAAGTRARPGRARRGTACHHTPRTNQPRTMTAMAVASRGEGSVPGGPPRSYLRSWRSVESGMSWRDIAAPRAHPITPPTVRNDGGSDGHAPVIVTKLIVSVTNSGSVNEGVATAPGRQHCNETWSARNEMGQRGDGAGVRGRIRPRTPAPS